MQNAIFGDLVAEVSLCLESEGLNVERDEYINQMGIGHFGPYHFGPYHFGPFGPFLKRHFGPSSRHFGPS